MIVTTAEAIKALGISKVRLNELARKGKIPRGPGPGKWDIDAIRVAMGKNLDARQPNAVRDATADKKRKQPPEDLGDETFAQVQLRHEQAKAAKAELIAKRMEGSLVDRSEVESAWTDIAVRVRNALLGIPAAAVNRLPSEWRRDVLTAVTDEVRKVLDSLSDAIRSDPQTT